jgi:flagellar secretion chaperone FliS
MAVATFDCEPDHAARPASRPGAAPVRSLLLVDGALERIDLARACIEGAADPRRHLHSAVLRVRELPAALAQAGDSALVANLADLSEYICRRLGSVGDHAGLATLADMCDLLREIRCAWVTPPLAANIICGAVAAAPDQRRC